MIYDMGYYMYYYYRIMLDNSIDMQQHIIIIQLKWKCNNNSKNNLAVPLRTLSKNLKQFLLKKLNKLINQEN